MTPSPLIVNQSLKRIVPNGSRCRLIRDAVPAVLLWLFVLIETSQTDVHNRARLTLVLPSRGTVFTWCSDFDYSCCVRR